MAAEAADERRRRMNDSPGDASARSALSVRTLRAFEIVRDVREAIGRVSPSSKKCLRGKKAEVELSSVLSNASSGTELA